MTRSLKTMPLAEDEVFIRVNTVIPAGVVIATRENGIVCAVSISGQKSGDFSRAHTVQFSSSDYPGGTDALREMAERFAR